MKEKQEKGVTGVDLVVGLVIFVFASSVIFTMYYNIYVNTVTLKIHEVAVGIITDVFEKIDLDNYDNITETRVNELINDSGAYEYFNEEKNHSTIKCTVQKYSDVEPVTEDLVKKINIVIDYQVNGAEKRVSLNKIKIRE